MGSHPPLYSINRRYILKISTEGKGGRVLNSPPTTLSIEYTVIESSEKRKGSHPLCILINQRIVLKTPTPPYF